MTAPLTLADRATESPEAFVERTCPWGTITLSHRLALIREVELRDEARSPQAQVVAETPRSSER